ncbi:hypothetical protein ASA1KI_05980 [Opitutales bacterium ASA1]|uniref:type II toxin-antitoxin system VapC family toxin n=1 Tax=Congregicoccus parvus TaxID=3081749 RepID=UPI002B2F438B|nr:hypothetical protein ASA1KI_05980 [Opitutales bacterium ASA1]
MAWVVDTCVVIDVLDGDPQFGPTSAACLQKLLPSGLTLCPVTMVELAAAFDGDLVEQKHFLDQAGIRHTDDWNPADTERAHAAWATYVRVRRAGSAVKRPIADVLIGAFACRFDGLVTRNPDDFKRWFPKLKIRTP